MCKRWYVVQAYSGYEARVKKILEERINDEGVSDKFGEILVPTEKIMEMRSGKKRKGERKFFPGYVLVHMVMNEESWHLVRSVPKVLGFVGGKRETPTPISDNEAFNILNKMQESTDKPKPKILFEPGELIRVTDGPFADFNGTVQEVNYEKNRLKVAVSIFGRSTPVDLDFIQVEKD